jgi:hypothetical protein
MSPWPDTHEFTTMNVMRAKPRIIIWLLVIIIPMRMSAIPPVKVKAALRVHMMLTYAPML